MNLKLDPQCSSGVNRNWTIKSNRIRAFTMIELLVVVAIIGILIGMLLPAVQQVREAARRTVCANNVAQVALACHNFEFSHEHFPSGVKDKTGPILNQELGLHVGFLVDLLVYIEQPGIANNFDVTLGTYAPANAPAREQRIATYRCPSGYNDMNGMSTAGVSDYGGCHNDVEAPIDVDNNGTLFLNSKIGFQDIADGSSNTILVGEIIPIDSDLGWASGTRSTLRNASEFMDNKLWKVRNAGVQPPDFVGGFGSQHPGGANFAMAGGGIRFLRNSIDPQFFLNLANREDGAMMGLPD